ncbi:FAD-dependent oxidoreductase [Myxococcaceae bacterium GXIMD 01537]
MKAFEVAVVGGGLGGLTVAALLAREGRAVTVYERAKHLGGRAWTTEVEGFRFNLGPHALYRAGAGTRVLGKLGIEPAGGMAVGEGAHVIRGGRLWTMPSGPVSLMMTDLLGLGAKLDLARLLGGLGRIDTGPLVRTGAREWLESNVARPEVREVVSALLRVATYTADQEVLSAGAALEQVRLAVSGGVRYLDGGWSALVDALGRVAREAGVRVVTSARVEAVEVDGRARGVRLADGSVREVDAVVVAGSPADVSSLLPGDERAARWAREAVPVRAATWELGLARLPRPRALFALGLDEPWYASVHSAYARGLAPEGSAMVHVAKYLKAGDEAREEELEGVMDLWQPGWREHLKVARFRPSLTVMHALPGAATGGLAGRPGPAVGHVPGLWVVGDWVGAEGMLADATFASAEAVARALLSHEAGVPAAWRGARPLEARAER